MFYDRRACARVDRAVQDAVHRSFDTDLVKRPVTTPHEVRRRTHIAFDWIAILRADCKWSVFKACDHVYEALRATLDGKDWEPPPADRSWAQKERMP